MDSVSAARPERTLIDDGGVDAERRDLRPQRLHPTFEPVLRRIQAVYLAEPGSPSEEALRKLAGWSETRTKLSAAGAGSETLRRRTLPFKAIRTKRLGRRSLALCRPLENAWAERAALREVAQLAGLQCWGSRSRRDSQDEAVILNGKGVQPTPRFRMWTCC